MDLQTFLETKQERIDKAVEKLTKALNIASKLFEEKSVEANKDFSDFLVKLEEEQIALTPVDEGEDVANQD